MLPTLSRTTPQYGLEPLVALKEASVVMPEPPATSSKTVPLPLAPPPQVVPNRLPATSRVNPPNDWLPMLELNDANTVIAVVPCATSKITPAPLVPPRDVPPNRFPAES